jgi:hypothetical protein
VVAGGRFGEQREFAVPPVEASGIDDHAADGGAVAADPLRRRGDHDVGTVVDRSDEVAGRPEGVVDHERDAVLVGHGGEALEVRDVVLGIADIDSTYSALVCSPMAAANSSGSSPSTKRTPMPRRGRTTLNWL